jgi:CheY-like chemotaxis protein
VPITFKVAPDVCDAVITDEEWLWQMLLNLLTNACKYTDKGSIQVNVQVDPSITLPITLHDALLFEVMDTGKDATYNPSSCFLGFSYAELLLVGVGVKGDKIAHIFDAFSQVQEGQVTGTGLGLFGVRTRAEGLQGTCGARHNIASSTGTGTVIWFAIPYQPDMAHVSDGERSRSSSVNAFDDGLSLGARILPVSSAPSEIALAMDSTKSSISASLDTSIFRDRQLTAMVVDDTLTVRKLMEKLLLKMGFARVDCYENGSKGLDAMMAGQVDIVFSDVQMPIMTGPEVTFSVVTMLSHVTVVSFPVQMTARFRAWEAQALRSGARTERQLIVAVTANGGQVEGDVLFDEVCAKPLGVAAIQGVIKRLL